jgi:hypothetical protein
MKIVLPVGLGKELKSDVKAMLVFLDQVGFQVTGPFGRLPSGFDVESITMPGANDFTQMVDRSFAERLAVVSTGIRYCVKFAAAENKADSFPVNNQQLWLVFCNTRSRLFCRWKDLNPIHNFFFARDAFLYLDPSIQPP